LVLAAIALFAFVLDIRSGSSTPESAEPEPHDPFAGGHPVPPLPGQELIVTRRAKATVAATAVPVGDDLVAVDAGTEGEESTDE
jgi:NADH-quinone oxidoreductase subunit H